VPVASNDAEPFSAAAASLGTEILMERGSSLPDHVRRHVTAARAFHTDLIAHAHRRLRLLINLAKHLNALRSHTSTLAEKLSAAESSRRYLETLEQLRRSSRETYSDFRTAVRRIHHHLNQLAGAKVRTATNELVLPTRQRVETAVCADRTTPDRTTASSSTRQRRPRRFGNGPLGA
jgi:hypothetical protein